MEIRGVSYDQFVAIVEKVSREKYDGNGRVQRDAKPLNSKSCRGRIDVHNSRGEGARMAWSGRRGPWACWHLTRDVLIELFNTFPDAKVRTSLAYYKGKDGFEQEYPHTAYHNIGSQMNPAYMPDLCNC